MEYKTLDHSINVIAYNKNDVNYVMTCAWGMNVDYDKFICLLGSQSVTGKNIKKGDIVGFSALSNEQLSIALALGDNHSDEKDKLLGINYYCNENAILITDSVLQYKRIVMDVIHLDEIEVDNLVYLKIIEGTSLEKEFLHMSDIHA